MAPKCQRLVLLGISEARDLQKAAITKLQHLSYTDDSPVPDVCVGSEMMLVKDDGSLVHLPRFVDFWWFVRYTV